MIFIFTGYQKTSLFFHHIAHNLDRSSVPIEVVVENSLLNTPPVTFSTGTVYRGILLGALRKLMASNADFK